jgi:hypothetical protein
MACRDDSETPSDRSDAGISIVQDVFALVSKNLSESASGAEWSWRGWGLGQGAAVPLARLSAEETRSVEISELHSPDPQR